MSSSDWQEKALCATRVRDGSCDQEWWHPETGDGRMWVSRAIAVCRACPVIRDCARYASDNRLIGVWGGIVRVADSNKGRSPLRVHR